MNNELERIWKEMIMAYSGYYPSICLQGLWKTTKLSQDSWVLAKIQTECLLGITFTPTCLVAPFEVSFRGSRSEQ
jgi:hypothetical protein